MEKQDNINLEELLEETATALLVDRKKGIAGQIKVMLQRTEGLNKDLKDIEKNKEKKSKQLKESLEKLEKLRKGDWSVLQEVNSKGEPIRVEEEVKEE